jgi:quinol-cytochrome oxidoreductase complex cytochrome b subunit
MQLDFDPHFFQLLPFLPWSFSMASSVYHPQPVPKWELHHP